MSTDEKKLKEEILLLEKEIENKKKSLFLLRFYKLVNINEEYIQDNIQDNIQDIKINVNIHKNTWKIEYTHKTNKYNENDYNHEDDIKTDYEPHYKKTNIIFGYNEKYFLNSLNDINRFKIYVNSQNDIRIINKDYDIELEQSEQYDLIQEYKMNKNIPEWLALRLLIYMYDNKWDSDSIIKHLGYV